MRRRLLVLLIASAMCISVSACGNQTESTAETETVSEISAEEEKSDEEESKRAEEEAKKAEEAKQVEIDKLYEDGRNALFGFNNTEIDYEKAYDSFSKLYELDAKKGAFYLGAMYDWFGYPEEDYKKASEYYLEAEEDGRAQISLALLYLTGSGVEEDVDKATEIAEEQAAKGNPDAEFYYGFLNMLAQETATGVGELAEFIEKGQEEIFLNEACILIANNYINIGDVDEAIKYYEKAATDYGNITAQKNLGYIYWVYDEYIDLGKSYEWYEKAANRGDVWAIECLTTICYEDVYPEDNYADLAYEWALKGADKGNGYCMYVLSDMYMQELGPDWMKEDFNMAFEWAEKSAEAGDIYGMENLAVLYQKGWGTEKNLEKALEWYEKSYEGGNEYAESEIEGVKSEM